MVCSRHPSTLTLRRRLPGRVKRVWAYPTETDLRRQLKLLSFRDLGAGRFRKSYAIAGRGDT
jgi:hypothetical protein